MQESRLFKIVYHLLDKGRATASELAEKFEVSVRTIYRDIDALSGAGIPIYAEAGRNGGIYLMNDFVMDKAVLTEEEKREILTALHSINSTSNIDNSQILQKLSAIFNVGSESWLEVDFSRWGNNGTDNAKFELLKSAVIQQRCVKITYANSYGTISERIIQPLKVLYKSMSWYLKAYCTEKQDYRIFKLTRIITLEMLSDTFDKKSFPELDEMSGQVYSTIVLRFAKEISYRVYGVSGMVKERKAQYKDLHTKHNIAGACLCVTALIPLFVGAIIDADNDLFLTIMLSLSFLIAGVGVICFIKTGIIWASYEKLLQEGEYSKENKEKPSFSGAIYTAYWVIATAVYLGYSLSSNNWGQSWIIWVVAGVIFPAVIAITNAFEKKSK